MSDCRWATQTFSVIDVIDVLLSILVIDEAATEAYPNDIVATLVALDTDGKEYRIDVANPLGHPANPMSDEQLRAKFRRLTLEYLGEGSRLDAVIADWEDIRAADSVEPLLGRL